ncbi:MAG: YceI family protein [Bacteroidota bacterium]
MFRLFLLGGFLLSIPSMLLAQRIDSAASSVTFEIKNMKINTVEGSFSGMKGEVNFDADDLSVCEFNVCIDASSVDTGNKKRDEHLRKDDFFHVERHPTICFTSSEIMRSGNAYTTKGVLDMNGVSKEVNIPFVLENNAFKGDLNINRFDYAIGDKYGKFMVDDEVTIRIKCVVEGL